MSVLIKMDMPERCGKCRFTTAFDCVVDGKFIVDHSKRRADCPLSDVPAHGRLIDADKLRDEMLLFVKENMLTRDDARELLATVNETPTVIETEENNATP